MNEKVYNVLFRQLSQRLRIFLNLPFDKIDRLSLQQRLEKISDAE